MVRSHMNHRLDIQFVRKFKKRLQEIVKDKQFISETSLLCL